MPAVRRGLPWGNSGVRAGFPGETSHGTQDGNQAELETYHEIQDCGDAKAAASAVGNAKGQSIGTHTQAAAASLADRQEMAPKQVSSLFGEPVALMVDHFKQGNRLQIGGLGVLEIKDRPGRTGRNLATRATIQIQASRKVAFRAAKELKDAV